jgi:hypothetical protein
VAVAGEVEAAAVVEGAAAEVEVEVEVEAEAGVAEEVARNARSWPTPLLGCPPAEALRAPVAPAVALTSPAPSAPRAQSLLDQWAKNSSVSAEGAVILLLEVDPKNATTISPGTVVVTDGATIDRLRGVKAPLWESTGAVGSTPLKSRIAPEAEVCAPKDQT